MVQVATGRVKITTFMRSKAFVDGWRDVMEQRGWRDTYDTDPKAQGRYERGRLFAVYVLTKHGERVRGASFKVGNREGIFLQMLP